MGYQYGFMVWVLSGGLFLGCASTPEKKDLSEREKAQLLVRVGNGALVEGDPTGALQSLARAELEADDLPDLHHSKALAYFAKHDLKNAIASARKAVELKPDYADANNTLGKFLLDARQYSEARPYLEKAAKDSLYRGAYKAWTNLGILEYREGNFSKAEPHLNQAIQAAPNDACIAYYYLGHIRLRAKQVDAAISQYSKATKKNCAQFGEAQIALGLAYEKSRQFDLARKTFLEIEKRYPNTKLSEQALNELRYLP